MGPGGENFLFGLMILFLGLDRLLIVDLMNFEEGGLKVMELGSFL